jgi:two-component system, cell cycle sensor histidine kinase and response regulator CckA
MLDILGSPDEDTTRLFNLFDLPTVDQSAKREFRALLDHGTPMDMNIDYVSMHGKTSFIRLVGVPLREDGEIVGALCQAFDIGPLRDAEQQLRRTAKMESLSLLAGSLAHDLNNIFTSLVGYSSLLEKGDLLSPDRQIHAATMVHQAAKSGARLVEQMVRFTSERRANAPACLLDKPFLQAISLFSYGLPSNISLETDNKAGALRIRGSRTKIEQIILNLALNARDAIGKQQGVVRIQAQPVSHPPADAVPNVTGPPGGFVEISVEDDGTGIAPEHLSKVFDPYFTTKAPGQGTGLGLSSVWGILRELGGTSVVDSNLGGGTRFSVYVPVTDRPESEARERTVSYSDLRGSGQRILIIEEDPQVRELLVWLLLNNGYKALAYESSGEAQEVLASSGHTIDAIVVELDQSAGHMLPDDQMFPSAPKPVVCITSVNRGPQSDDLLVHVAKPFSPDDFLRTLARLLGQTHS